MHHKYTTRTCLTLTALRRTWDVAASAFRLEFAVDEMAGRCTAGLYIRAGSGPGEPCRELTGTRGSNGVAVRKHVAAGRPSDRVRASFAARRAGVPMVAPGRGQWELAMTGTHGPVNRVPGYVSPINHDSGREYESVSQLRIAWVDLPRAWAPAYCGPARGSTKKHVNFIAFPGR